MTYDQLSSITCRLPACERKEAGELIVLAEKHEFVEIGLWAWLDRAEFRLADLCAMNQKGDLVFLVDLRD